MKLVAVSRTTAAAFAAVVDEMKENLVKAMMAANASATAAAVEKD